ncbi:MAG: hypothetical protein B7733_26470 [Myxococcales bacterium FL481]|nr:MAG: hypothetical protein B7733_26470 [Myxococcales bacterium FL481]
MSASPPLVPRASPTDRPASAAMRLASEFSDPALLVDMGLVLGFALALVAIIAYHPSLRAKATTRAAAEQPKTLVLYGLVGALVGHLVSLNEMMALVVFGIGGLMRFRTDMGDAKDTGRVMLVAIVGICCGVQSFLVATLATACGWLLIMFLERQVVGGLDVMQVQPASVDASSTAYRALISDAGCRIIGERKSPNPKRPAISLVFTVPARVDRQALIARADKLPSELRGTTDWHLS